MTPAPWAMLRIKSVAQRRGAAITIRFISRVSGQDPQPSPPMVVGNLTLSAQANPADANLSLSASTLVGRFSAGDRLTVGSGSYIVQASATAVSNQVSVSILPAVAITHAAGSVVSPSWASDVALNAMVLQQPSSGTPGQPETRKSLAISIPALDLPRPPAAGDIITRSGEKFTVSDVSPEMIGGVAVSYTVRAR